jgi:uncharacterized membrane protein
MAWLAAIVTAPLAFGHEPRVMAAPVYAMASRICHQQPARSFVVQGVQMPVCARCFGLYLAGTVGALAGWVGRSGRRISRTRTMIMAAALPTAVTWILEATGLVAFGNAARFVAALPLGISAGWVFVQLLRYDAGLHAGEVHNSRFRTYSL